MTTVRFGAVTITLDDLRYFVEISFGGRTINSFGQSTLYADFLLCLKALNGYART